MPPPEPTLLDRAVAERGSKVIGIGKIGDIFAHRGVTEVRKAAGNMALFDTTLGAMDDAGDGDLVFANFVDFDRICSATAATSPAMRPRSRPSTGACRRRWQGSSPATCWC